MAARKKSKRSATHHPLPSWVWLATGLVIGLSATFILRDGAIFAPIASKSSVETKPEPTVKKERKFDFYTLLPELEVVVPVDDSSTSPAQAPTANSNELYILQVGSFKNFSDADELKASLALMGIESEIEKVTVNSQVWHRVRVGPNPDRRTLQAVKNRLARQRIDTLLLKVRS